MQESTGTTELDLAGLIDSIQRAAGAGPLVPEAAERLRLELEERRRAEQASRDSAARLRAIVNTAVDGILTINERGIVEWMNPAAERIFGYTASEVIGQNVSMLMPEPYHSQHDQYLHNYVSTGIPKIIGIGREVVGKRKDGSTFPMDLAVSAVQLGDRRLFTGITRDITERKKVEEELRAAKEVAERSAQVAEAANRAKDQFLAVLSHELRTPLMPVLATMSFVEAKPDIPAELRTEISTIRRNVEMEARLIDDLLDLTRISKGKIELHPEVLDAHASLRSALETCQSDIEQKELEVSLSLRAKNHHIWADPARIQQVFWNLVKNAVKFTPAGGRIALRSSNTPDDKLSIEVSDSGIGIEPEAMTRIFNAFEQADIGVTRKFGGLGLGLAISKALVELHEGVIHVHSDGLNKGATFTVELATVAATTAVSQPIAPVTTQPETHGKGVSILLVEDHSDTLRIMSRLLQKYGYSVRTATNVNEALRIAGDEKFDLLISDLGLPDGSGLDIMRHVKAHYGTKGIALSGFGMDDDIRRSKEAGFELHLTKPINFAALDTVIQRVAH